jgi:uncharacterized protein YkwD
VRRPRQLIATLIACSAVSLSCVFSGLAPVAAAAELNASPTASASKHHGPKRSSRACRSRRSRAHRARHSACRKVSRTSHTRASHAKQPAGGDASQATAAALAAVLATPCTNTEITPAADNLALASAAVLCLVNHERAQNGETPLRSSARLQQAAEAHCTDMIANDYFAHVSPGGETPVDRIRATGYLPGPPFGYVIGENLAWGTYGLSTPQAIVSAWVASPGHLANILEPRYTETGIAITASVPSSLGAGAPGATYGQEFGAILD